MTNDQLEAQLHVWAIDDGETCWWVAVDAEDALELHARTTHGTVAEYLDDIGVRPEITRLPDGSLFRVHSVDEPGCPVEEKSCREWCEGGKRCIAMTAV